MKYRGAEILACGCVGRERCLDCHPSAAERFLSDLAKICLPVSEAHALFACDRSTVYRWASGQTPLPELAKRLLKYEVEACSVGRHGVDRWQGFRNDRQIGPPCDTRAEAFWYALDLPR